MSEHPLVTREELAAHDGLVITADRYHTDARLREVADRVMAALVLEPRSVMQLRITLETISVDLIRWDQRLGEHVQWTAHYANMEERGRDRSDD